MRIEVGDETYIKLVSAGFRIEVINKDTNKIIDQCIWADDETGEYCEYVYKNGRPVIDETKNILKTQICKANIKINLIILTTQDY